MNPKCRYVLYTNHTKGKRSQLYLSDCPNYKRRLCKHSKAKQSLSSPGGPINRQKNSRCQREKRKPEKFCSISRLQFVPLELKAKWSQPRLQLNIPLKPLKEFLLHEDNSKLASERLTFLKFTCSHIMGSYITFMGFTL